MLWSSRNENGVSSFAQTGTYRPEVHLHVRWASPPNSGESKIRLSNP